MRLHNCLESQLHSNVIYESFVTISKVENSEWKEGDRPHLEEATSNDWSFETGSS